MVMSTTYNLDPSFTKQAVIGLDVNKDGNLSPCIKFMSSHPRSFIVLSEEDWEVFKSYFKVFELFFNGERCDLNCNLIKCENFQLRFGLYFDESVISLQQTETSDSYYPFLLRKTTFVIPRELKNCITHCFYDLLIEPYVNLLGMIIKTIAESLWDKKNVTYTEKEVESYI